MKVLKFDEKLKNLILSGQKTSTWRLFDDKDIKKDDELEFVVKQTSKMFAKAVVVSVREKKLIEIDETDYKGHEKFKDKEEMINSYKKYYKNKPVDSNSIVKIIDFELKQ